MYVRILKNICSDAQKCPSLLSQRRIASGSAQSASDGDSCQGCVALRSGSSLTAGLHVHN